MIDFLKKLFGVVSSASFRKVDWLAVEGKVRQLEQLLTTTDQANSKQLIIQADMLIDSILKDAMVSGNTMGERLKNVRDRLPKNIYGGVWQAHIKRNELVHDSGSFVADWEKSKYFDSYKQAVSALRGLK